MKNKSKLPERSAFPLMETHCHLDYLKDNEVNQIVKQSHELNIDKIITIAVEPENQNKVLSLASRFDNVWCTQGIHPHEARLFDDQTYNLIKKNAENENVLAIGEIGLDYHYDHSPRNIQRLVFEKQLQLAIDLSLPIIIHSREAEKDTKDILKNFVSQIKNPVVIHCFTSSMNFAEFAIRENFYLGFNGIISFKPANNVRDILKITPIELIVLETDAPFLSPVPVRGRENSPAYLPYIAHHLAQILEMSEEELLPQIYKNSLALFNL